jgi:hypothetical protein
MIVMLNNIKPEIIAWSCKGKYAIFLFRPRLSYTTMFFAELLAVCHQDAKRIFKKCTLNEKGNQDKYMTMVKFHEGVELVAKLLQTPLNGQPDGKAARPRQLLRSKDPLGIQNANTLTLKEEDKFVSHVREKQKIQMVRGGVAPKINLLTYANINLVASCTSLSCVLADSGE